jgi:cytidine deaminase
MIYVMSIEFKIESTKEIEELLETNELSIDNLKYLASEVAKNSWSPFSNFPVGAVVVGIDQNKKLKVFSGTNVEPTVHLGQCAERVAIYNGITAGYKRFIAMAISIPKATEGKEVNFYTPCGGCREVMLQKMISKGLIVSDKTERTFTPKELLPKPVLDQIKLKGLTIEEMDALDTSRRALHNAHVPHSKEKYGVALLVEDIDDTLSATTVDSNSTNLSCEPIRAVLGRFVAKYGADNLKDKIKAICFAYPFIKYPSGDVLQLISDYAKPDTKIIIDNMGVTTIEELLPWGFRM